MNIINDFKIHNNFDFVITETKTGEVTNAKAYNVVLDRFYEKTSNPDSNNPGIDSIQVGSGTSAPSKTDTVLGNLLLTRGNGGSWNTEQFKVGGNGILVFSGSIKIQTNELVGSNITEVGLSGGQGLMTRALLQDANGNVISIAKTDTMVVDVYATAYITIPQTISGYKMMNRYSPMYQFEASRLIFLPGWGSNIYFYARRDGGSWAEPIKQYLKEAPSFNKDVSYAYNSGILGVDYSLSIIPTTEGNIGGIRSVYVGKLIEIPVPNDDLPQPVLTKEVVGTGDGVNKGFSTEFGWIRDNGTFKVYVNDILQSTGYTVRYNTPQILQADWYMENTGKSNSNGSATYRNPTGAKIVKTLSTSRTGHYINASDNPDGVFENAAQIVTSNVWYDIPGNMQDKEYWGANDDYSLTVYNETKFMFGHEVIFDVPPTDGHTVAITYQPDCIAKNSDRVIKDISFSLGLK